ncbi:basic leucine zipper 4-like [Punica granatum]|uniref:Basic leucine zipper 4-like n=1 Tax=Punica granatum TaxID=22663 RepID=A0A218XBJ1_PUNGR|nr:basic leucine zipper 4-like [Punica granatum]OWM82080.1 hypothetical protein CDL15_Pgr001654 [Punica granatum]
MLQFFPVLSFPLLPLLKQVSVAMMSVFPAGILPVPMPEIPLPSFETDFMPWGCAEPDLLAAHSPKPVISSPSGSDESTQNHHNSSSNNSDDQKTGTTSSIMDERKRRRMISNRESARRSRMRKQKHLENLRNQVNRLRIENRELTNKLRFVLYHCHRVRTDNDRLRSEHFALLQKLASYSEIMLLQQHQQFVPAAWPCNALISSEKIPSLIT